MDDADNASTSRGGRIEDFVSRHYRALLSALPLMALLGGLVVKAFDRGVSEGAVATRLAVHDADISTLKTGLGSETAARIEADRALNTNVNEVKISFARFQGSLDYVTVVVNEIRLVMLGRPASSATPLAQPVKK